MNFPRTGINQKAPECNLIPNDKLVWGNDHIMCPEGVEQFTDLFNKAGQGNTLTDGIINHLVDAIDVPDYGVCDIAKVVARGFQSHWAPSVTVPS